jgi:isopenicillin-N N-acyltransferase like protein
MAELAGIAEGFGLAETTSSPTCTWARCATSRATLRLLDGCSAWAVPGGPDGPLVVKNRDFSGTHLGIQTLRAFGPRRDHRGDADVGSLGSPGAYSSGHQRGGAGACRHAGVGQPLHRVGWLRYFLMTRLLAQCCGSVAEALDFIRSCPMRAAARWSWPMPRAPRGGGTRRGRAARSHRARHALAHQPLHAASCPTRWPPAGDRIAASSAGSASTISPAPAGATGTVAEALALMATHPDTAPGAAPLCQHGDGHGRFTDLSSVVYSCRLRRH